MIYIYDACRTTLNCVKCCFQIEPLILYSNTVSEQLFVDCVVYGRNIHATMCLWLSSLMWVIWSKFMLCRKPCQ